MDSPRKADGSLDLHVSRDKQYGEPTMMEFIKKHLGEILRPFAEHVDELHQSVDKLTDDLQNTENKATQAHEKLEAQQKQLHTTRADLDKTNNMALSTKAGLEKTNAEKELLEAEHLETRNHLTKTHNRLLEAVAHLDKLQHGLDETNTKLGRTQLSLSNTQKQISQDLEPKLKSHEEDLAKHDSLLAATSQLLNATKRFSENSHDEFKAHVEAREKLNRKDRERFEQVDDKIAHMSTMLTETINRLNTHANHLRSTNAAIRPLQERVEKLEGAQNKTDKIDKEQYATEQKLQDEVDEINKSLSALKAKFSDHDPNFNVYKEINMLKTNLGKTNTHLGDVEGAVNGANAKMPVHERRLQILEQGKDHHTEQLSHLQKTVGVSKKEIPPPPALPPPPVGIRPVAAPPPQKTDDAPTKASLPKRIIREGPSIMTSKFQDVVAQMSIKEKQKQFKERFEQQQLDMLKTNASLGDTQKELAEKIGPRIRTMENHIMSLTKDVNDLKQGMDLTEEYWKGLSRGFRETHKGVAIDRELVQTPRGGRALLPALAKSSPLKASDKTPPGSARKKLSNTVP